ncbi:DUF222 domain-containing protein [Mycolicibacterium murale]|uniref:13E12 repeat family protein n=1 Tax=Mycolicibacterium murale TaxID=182220 RepID=UPI0021F3B17A|nr:13E12 repeat family protein [Mycolicibacterium murale]MCV7185629.1 DUF222 domain-containing protein [Mycolicibacterium murale]
MFAGLPDCAARSQMTDVQLDDAITTFTALAATVAAHRLLFIAEKTSRTYTDDYDTVDDTEAAWKSAAAEISLASDTSHGRASNDMEIGLALATRLPRIAELLLGGQISEYIARRIVHRTANIIDPDLLATVEAHLAEAATTWGALSVKKLDDAIDVWVNRYDPAAVRQVRVRVRDRGVEILETKDGVTEVLLRLTGADAALYWQRITAMAKGVCTDEDGVTEVLLRLTGADAALYWQRITAMAKGVCTDDPRTLDQRRADAHGALGAGFFHLACQCGNPDCPAAADDGRASQVVVHIYSEAATLDAEPDPLMDGDTPLPTSTAKRRRWTPSPTRSWMGTPRCRLTRIGRAATSPWCIPTAPVSLSTANQNPPASRRAPTTAHLPNAGPRQTFSRSPRAKAKQRRHHRPIRRRGSSSASVRCRRR